MSIAKLNAMLKAQPSNPRFHALRRGVGVKRSEDLERILRLPRKTDVDTSYLTKQLRRPEGKQELRPQQALALHYASTGGLAAPMRVGSGKTLVTLLMAEMLGAERPVLLVPKALVEKTIRDYAFYLQHWRVRKPRIVGYELLGRKQSMRMLHELRPDLLMADEAHKLKSIRAACTKRVQRYVDESGCRFIPLSGTMMSSYTRGHHLFGWALHDGSPMPLEYSVAEEWDQAVDPRTPVGRRIDPGALRSFGGADDSRLARAIRDWIVNTPGVVAVDEAGCDASIVCDRWKPPLPEALRQHIAKVEMFKKRPDDVDLDPLEAAACLSQLACGFWLGWDPLPPLEWLAARREWVLFCNDVLEDPELSKLYDSPEMVADAYPDRWAAWESVKRTFTPNPVAYWIDDAPLRAAVEWAKAGNIPGIVWSRWREVGARLEKLGLPHHGAKGLDRTGKHIEQATGTVSASIATCKEGCNLQHYQRNLLLTLPSEPDIWEQLLGRTHREGQDADEVFFDFYTPTDYHRKALERSVMQAEQAAEDTKLAAATWL